MKKLSTMVVESLKSDTDSASKMLKKLTRFKGDLDKIQKKDTENLFGKKFKELNKLLDSTIESISYSIVGAKVVSVSESLVEITNGLKLLHVEAKLLLDEMNKIDDKNTTLSTDFVDAIVDFGDAVDMLKELSRLKN